MGKLIGIDLGLKRTGIAITDELQIIGSPLETVATKDVMEYLAGLIAKENIEALILGEPRHLDGNASHMTENAHRMKVALEKKFPGLSVILEDERYTSKMAAEALRASGAKKKKRRDRSVLDKISAALILQSYLEKRNLRS